MKAGFTKRGKYHEKWTANDTILSYYCQKFGATSLETGSHDEDDALETVANHYIGSSLGSLKQQMMNIKFLLTNGSDGLSCFSKIQKDVFEKYNSYEKNDLRNLCLEIIDKIDTKKVYEEYKRMTEENDAIAKYNKSISESKKRLEEINKIGRKDQIAMAAIALRKNPKKLVSLEEYKKKHPEFQTNN